MLRVRGGNWFFLPEESLDPSIQWLFWGPQNSPAIQVQPPALEGPCWFLGFKNMYRWVESLQYDCFAGSPCFFSCTSGMFTGICLSSPGYSPGTSWYDMYDYRYPMNTLQGTNISPKNGILSRWFSELPVWWDMLIPWRISRIQSWITVLYPSHMVSIGDILQVDKKFLQERKVGKKKH